MVRQFGLNIGVDAYPSAIEADPSVELSLAKGTSTVELHLAKSRIPTEARLIEASSSTEKRLSKFGVRAEPYLAELSPPAEVCPVEPDVVGVAESRREEPRVAVEPCLAE